MIKLILSGGLGNQMFEYAAGRALSIRCKTDLSFDLYLLNKNTKATIRNYGLGVFNIDNPTHNSIVNKLVVKIFGSIKSRQKGYSFLNKLGIFRDDKAQHYDNRFELLSEKATLFGYFQNEKYFKDISEQLRSDFTFKSPLIGKNDEIGQQIAESTSVSVHIRRGDYNNSNSNLPILDTSYYKKAIDYIASQISNPRFFIFSDEIGWVKENIDLSDFDYECIDWNKNDSSYIDMQLMSLCKHNIIANSSFSWWGAWLNNNSGKIVIAPQKWYKQDTGNYPEGFLPENWIVL